MNNLINCTDGLIILGTTSTSVTLSIAGVGVIIVPIVAGVGCATGILIKICSSWLKKSKFLSRSMLIYKKQLKTYWRTLYTNSLKDNKINKGEYKRFVNLFLWKLPKYSFAGFAYRR